MAVAFILCFSLFLLDRSRSQSVATTETGKFWQITDMHLDVNYSEHGDVNNECHGNFSSNGTSIGRYGNFLCDAPWLLVRDSIQAMKAIEPSPDFILWTGDSSAHVKPSDLNWTKVYSNLEKITTLLVETFPTTKIIPVIGNHDAYPANDFPSENIKQQYQGYLTKARWDLVIPPEVEATFRRGGYYSYSVSNNLSVIVVNTNLYLCYNTERSNETDPTGQFAWLSKELENAQTSNTKVIITGHVPPGYFERMPIIPFMTSKFNDLYVSLLLNYSDIILTQIYGHTHADSFRLISSNEEQSPPKTHAFIAPSVTPWKVPLTGMKGINPSIRLYKFSTNPSYMVDYNQYFLNITNANESPANETNDVKSSSNGNSSAANQEVTKPPVEKQLKWELLYTATDLYGVENLSLASLDKMYTEISTNSSVFKTYYEMNTAGVPSSPCDQVCHHGHICSIRYVTTETIDSCLSVTDDSSDGSSNQTDPGNANASPILIKIYTVSSTEANTSNSSETSQANISSTTESNVEPTKPSKKHHKHRYQKEFIYGITGIAIGLFTLLVLVVILGRRYRNRSGFRYRRF